MQFKQWLENKKMSVEQEITQHAEQRCNEMMTVYMAVKQALEANTVPPYSLNDLKTATLRVSQLITHNDGAYSEELKKKLIDSLREAEGFYLTLLKRNY